MAHPIIRRLRLTKKLRLAASAFAAVAGPIVLSIASAPRLRAQTAAPLAFEVASIRPSVLRPGTFFVKKLLPTSDVPFRISGNRVITPRRTVTDLILAAYDVKDFQISGAPSWASQTGDRYDIEAKASGDTAPNLDQFRLMFQSLLADRFQLKLHRDSKQLPTYDLVIGKRGSRLKPVPPDAPPSKGQHSLDHLVEALSQFLDRPVIDKTGLSGNFEYAVPLAQLVRAKSEDPNGFAMGAVSSVVEESLGLKLESAKDQVQILVIDRVEKPSEN
jgi:uncharacterized protein (TIGR03435 family)